MNKGILSLILCVFMAVMSCGTVFADDGNAELVMEVNSTNSSVFTGDVFSVDFNITKNAGFNSFTFFVDYNPEVIVPLAFDSNDSDSDWMSVSENSDSKILSKNSVNKQIAVVPGSNDSDFAGLNPDGNKTAGQLGRVKISARIYNSGKLGTTSATGKLFSMKFKAIGGLTAIDVVGVNSGFAPVLTSTNKELTTSYTGTQVSVTSEITAEVDNTIYVVNLTNGSIVSAVSSATTINVPDTISDVTIKSIGENAFVKCTNAEEVNIASGIGEIGKSAFSGCNALKKVSIAKTVKVIDDYAFKNCSKLTDVVLPYGVKLGIGSFSECSSLKRVSFA